MARILVIDDDELARFTLQDILEQENHEVTVAKDGDEGNELFTAEPFPLVITDILMPEKDGLQTIIDLKKDYPDTKIIAITGGGRLNIANLMTMARQLGADHAFMKPFGTDEILDCVKECLTS